MVFFFLKKPSKYREWRLWSQTMNSSEESLSDLLDIVQLVNVVSPLRRMDSAWWLGQKRNDSDFSWRIEKATSSRFTVYSSPYIRGWDKRSGVCWKRQFVKILFFALGTCRSHPLLLMVRWTACRGVQDSQRSVTASVCSPLVEMFTADLAFR